MKTKNFYVGVPLYCKPVSIHTSCMDETCHRFTVTLEYEESVNPKDGDFVSFNVAGSMERHWGIFKDYDESTQLYHFHNIHLPYLYYGGDKTKVVKGAESFQYLGAEDTATYERFLRGKGLIWNRETKTLDDVSTWKQETGFPYFYVDFDSPTFEVREAKESGSQEDKDRHLRGNYYARVDDAKLVSEKFNLVQKEANKIKCGNIY